MVKKSFKKYPRSQKIVYAIIVGAAIVLFWRGIWHLADIALFPGNQLASAIASLVIAIPILILGKHAVEGLLGIEI